MMQKIFNKMSGYEYFMNPFVTELEKKISFFKESVLRN